MLTITKLVTFPDIAETPRFNNVCVRVGGPEMTAPPSTWIKSGNSRILFEYVTVSATRTA